MASAPKIVTVGGKEYAVSKANAIQQFHIARKFAPLIAVSVKNNEEATEFASNIASFEGVASYLASLSEAQANDILYACLQFVRPKIEGVISATPIVINHNGKLVLQDEALGFGELIMLVSEVVKENLADFTKGMALLSPQRTPEASQPTS